ncbi:hypothetical protein QBC34DRAFT_497208 [Podospora aff. communis PSN243]|uniref:Transporter n=1 Tax=Podospora aff. communis PSN243 TaxID=3040156 RepID=A0AAV9GD58_9PEZI|nr:hypothetical protein QBC34DRAFT_497208 [Podospora aff. communis PSN243]
MTTPWYSFEKEGGGLTTFGILVVMYGVSVIVAGFAVLHEWKKKYPTLRKDLGHYIPAFIVALALGSLWPFAAVVGILVGILLLIGDFLKASGCCDFTFCGDGAITMRPFRSHTSCCGIRYRKGNIVDEEAAAGVVDRSKARVFKHSGANRHKAGVVSRGMHATGPSTALARMNLTENQLGIFVGAFVYSSLAVTLAILFFAERRTRSPRLRKDIGLSVLAFIGISFLAALWLPWGISKLFMIILKNHSECCGIRYRKEESDEEAAVGAADQPEAGASNAETMADTELPSYPEACAERREKVAGEWRKASAYAHEEGSIHGFKRTHDFFDMSVFMIGAQTPFELSSPFGILLRQVSNWLGWFDFSYIEKRVDRRGAQVGVILAMIVYCPIALVSWVVTFAGLRKTCPKVKTDVFIGTLGFLASFLAGALWPLGIVLLILVGLGALVCGLCKDCTSCCGIQCCPKGDTARSGGGFTGDVEAGLGGISKEKGSTVGESMEFPSRPEPCAGRR